MNRQILIIIGFVIVINFQSFGQSFNKQFTDLVAKKDTSAQIKLLKNWEVKNNNDPELYIAYFNYYINKSMDEVLSLDIRQRGKDSLEIRDIDSKTDGHQNSKIMNGGKYLYHGFEYLDKGISKFPSRLDMRFSKILMLEKIKDYKNFTHEIVKTIDDSEIVKNKWLWTDNKPVDEPKKFMLNAIQNWIVQLYNTNDAALRNNMKLISETVLKYYPDHVESLSNLSVVYLLKYDYDKALEVLLKAEKFAPQDHIVLSNIAQAYKLKGDNQNAIKYYKLTIQYGDDKTKEFAKGQIQKLNSK